MATFLSHDLEPFEVGRDFITSDDRTYKDIGKCESTGTIDRIRFDPIKQYDGRGMWQDEVVLPQPFHRSLAYCLLYQSSSQSVAANACLQEVARVMMVSRT